ncbi:hypothetical protein L6452_00590 [Arctium lappa]|uniref:Uncharacterized protein n=1 Tax=Arctium lappa TaxID=4217 RepID=A0ACB9FF60_ARCLA|nr:hypothetical protein L6452_00590 [Arctium lappa]
MDFAIGEDEGQRAWNGLSVLDVWITIPETLSTIGYSFHFIKPMMYRCESDVVNSHGYGYKVDCIASDQGGDGIFWASFDAEKIGGS